MFDPSNKYASVLNKQCSKIELIKMLRESCPNFECSTDPHSVVTIKPGTIGLKDAKDIIETAMEIGKKEGSPSQGLPYQLQVKVNEIGDILRLRAGRLEKVKQLLSSITQDSYDNRLKTSDLSSLSNLLEQL